MTTPEQIAVLSEHRLDLGFGWTPDVGPGLSSLLVAREPLVVALAEAHPWRVRSPWTRRICRSSRSPSSPAM